MKTLKGTLRLTTDDMYYIDLDDGSAVTVLFNTPPPDSLVNRRIALSVNAGYVVTDSDPAFVVLEDKT